MSAIGLSGEGTKQFYLIIQKVTTAGGTQYKRHVNNGRGTQILWENGMEGEVTYDAGSRTCGESNKPSSPIQI